MSSHLYQILREQKAYAYSIHSSAEFYEDTGVFSIQGDVDPKKLIPCVRTIREILRETYQNLLGEDEIIHAKAYLKGGVLQSMEDSLATMLWIGELCSSGQDHINLQNYLSRIKKVKASVARGLVCFARGEGGSEKVRAWGCIGSTLTGFASVDNMLVGFTLVDSTLVHFG